MRPVIMFLRCSSGLCTSPGCLMKASPRHSELYASHSSNLAGSRPTMAAHHPVASHKDQLAWEQALQRPNAPTVSQRFKVERQDHGTQQLLTAHPAVGATQAECAAWEEALGSNSVTAAAHDHPLAAADSGVYAVVECGSHCTRLLLSTGAADLSRLTQDTHLGVALSPSSAQQQTDILAAAAATLAAVQQYKQHIDRHKHQLKGLVAVATAAVREAPNNGRQLAVAVHNILHCPVRVLSGDEEAHLAFKGATAGLASVAGGRGTSRRLLCLVVDLGGRSTEFALGCAGASPELVASIPLGCLSILQCCNKDSSSTTPSTPAPTQQELLQAAQSILSTHRASLEGIRTALAVHRQQAEAAVTVVVTGGTATSLAALQLQLPEYVHEAVHLASLCRDDIKQLMQQLLEGDSAAPDCWPTWLTAARASTLAPGCAGLLAVMDCVGVDQLLVSDCDLLDGVVAELQQCQQPCFC